MVGSTEPFAAQCGSLQQQGPREQRVSSKTLPWQGSLWCSPSKQPQAGCFGSLSRPCSPKQQGLKPFCWMREFSSYLPQWGQITFINLFLRISLCVFSLICFTFYLLKTKMSNVLCREGERRGKGIPAPDVTCEGSSGGGRGRKHNRPCSDGPSDAETWSEQTNKVKAVKLNDYFYLFPCWFVFSLPFPCPQLCAPLESSHLALVFAGHGTCVYYIYFKQSAWETDSSQWIPNTFYNQLHYWH